MRDKGAWPDPAELVAEAGAGNAVGWTHSRTDGGLNGDRALDAVKAVIMGSDTGNIASPSEHGSPASPLA